MSKKEVKFEKISEKVVTLWHPLCFIFDKCFQNFQLSEEISVLAMSFPVFHPQFFKSGSSVTLNCRDSKNI